jgi:hypothetical protein
LNSCVFFVRVQFNNVVQVFRPIDNHGDIATLSSQTGATTSRKDWRAEPVASSDGPDYVIG